MVFAKLQAAVGLAIASGLPLASASSHFIMGGLSPIAYERVDSIVNPGSFSSHTHAIVGANNFGPNSDYNSNRQATCTSVPFQDVDKSVYWAPPVYHQDQQTKQFKLMPSTFNIYYFFDRNGPGEKVHAFPAGLKMLAGSPMRSTYNASNHEDQAVSFVCLDYSGAVSNNPAYAERKDIHFPDINACKDGIRIQVFFPQCWDGKNLDSADHKSHMAYPVDNYNGGSCPSSHPVHTVGIFYEMIIPTKGYNYWGEGAYVLSTGDPDGLTHHGDFLNGWDVDVLQDAVDNCHNMNGDINACQVLKPYINQDKARACTLSGEVLQEDVGIDNPIPALPGCNPVRTDFSKAASCSNVATPSFAASTAPLTSGWGEVGCIAEGTNGRALKDATTKSANMTRNFCAGFCGSKGFKYAGVEFGDECYCGNSFSNGASANTVGSEQCSSPCAGNPTYEKCGGPQRLTLLQAGAAPAQPATSAAAPAKPATSVAAPVVTPSAAPVASSASSSSAAASSTAPANNGNTAVAQPPASSKTGTWAAAGCIQDGAARALSGYSFSSPSMTTELCTSTCASKGFSMAGTEFSTECYCGNSLSNGLGAQVDAGRQCYMTCAGNKNERCGGTWASSLYKLSNASTTTSAKRTRHFGRQHHRLGHSSF